MIFYPIKLAPFYEVSRDGIVRNRINSRELVGSVNGHGYRHFGFRLGFPKRKYLTLHLILAHNFIEGNSQGLQINHKDGCKLNNNLNNLEWVTPQQNSQHRHDMKLQVSIRGEKHVKAKLKNRDIAVIRRLLRDGLTQQAIANVYGVSQGLIYNIRSGKAWKHCG